MDRPRAAGDGGRWGGHRRWLQPGDPPSSYALRRMECAHGYSSPVATVRGLQPVRVLGRPYLIVDFLRPGWFCVREKHCSQLEIYDRLRASEQARVLPRLTMEKEKEKEKKTTTPAGSTRKTFSSTGVEDPSLYKGKGLEKHPLRESTRHV